jgi:phosphoribosylamine--glycine ligase
VFDGDTGPNTGGMGAYSPAPVLPEERYSEIVNLVFRPVLKSMEKRGCPFTGILYAGLIMTRQGPMVIEFNARFGDPECQPLLMRLESDLLAAMLACAQGRLHEVSMTYSRETALCVVIAAKGYPGVYGKGMEISGLTEAEASSFGKIKIFHAGTRIENGKIVSSGGRVLGITALGKNLAAAQKTAYEAAAKIRMNDSHFRRDIGSKGLGLGLR